MYLFINLNQEHYRPFVQNKYRASMPPFGVAYVAGLLKSIGEKSFLHDDHLERFSDNQFRDLFRKYKGEVKAVGLTSISTTLRQIDRLSRISKEVLPDVPVITGGPHARLAPMDIMRFPTVDICFTSEVEVSMVDWIRGKKLSEIESIVYRENGEIKQNPMKTIVQDLDSIPFPNYDVFNIQNYYTTKGINKRHPTSYIITSRGCPYQCTFCSSKTLNPTGYKQVRYRSAKNVVEELKMAALDYGVREMFFSDDLLTVNTEHIMNLCEEMVKAKLDLIWVCMTHANTITPEKLKWMKKAGCHQICYGVEAGDVEIPKKIKKGLKFETAFNAVRMTQEAGIDARCSFMFGNQDETPETMQKTIDLAKALKPDFASFNIATPYPGTGLRDWAIENNYLVDTAFEALDSSSYTMVTPTLPPGTVEKYCDKAFRSFYYSFGYIFRRMKHVRDWEDIKRYVESIGYALSSIPMVFRSIFKKEKIAAA